MVGRERLGRSQAQAQAQAPDGDEWTSPLSLSLCAGRHSCSHTGPLSVLLGSAYNWKLALCTCTRTCTLRLPTLPTMPTRTHIGSPAPATAASRPCCCRCCCCLLFPATDALGETATLQRWNGKEGLDGGVAEKG